MKEIQLKVPNLGEAEDTEIIEISVSKGDKLSKNVIRIIGFMFTFKSSKKPIKKAGSVSIPT